jgi:hypothetical protein
MRTDHDEHDLETVYLTHMRAAERCAAELPELSFG